MREHTLTGLELLKIMSHFCVSFLFLQPKQFFIWKLPSAGFHEYDWQWKLFCGIIQLLCVCVSVCLTINVLISLLLCLCCHHTFCRGQAVVNLKPESSSSSRLLRQVASRVSVQGRAAFRNPLRRRKLKSRMCQASGCCSCRTNHPQPPNSVQLFAAFLVDHRRDFALLSEKNIWLAYSCFFFALPVSLSSLQLQLYF